MPVLSQGKPNIYTMWWCLVDAGPFDLYVEWGSLSNTDWGAKDHGFSLTLF